MWARKEPGRFFIGVDANAAGLRELSGRAFRAGLANVLFVRAAIEDLPPELGGIAGRVTVVLPWGSLLAAVARPSLPILQGIRALCRPGASFTAVLGHDPVRDQQEMLRLGLPTLEAAHLVSDLATGYADAGFTLTSVRALHAAELTCWPSSWARRLAHGGARSFLQIDARARGSERRG